MAFYSCDADQRHDPDSITSIEIEAFNTAPV